MGLWRAKWKILHGEIRLFFLPKVDFRSLKNLSELEGRRFAKIAVNRTVTLKIIDFVELLNYQISEIFEQAKTHYFKFSKN